MVRRLPLRWSVPTLLLGVAIGLGVVPGLSDLRGPRPSSDDEASPDGSPWASGSVRP